jgi:hypothetical protein
MSMLFPTFFKLAVADDRGEVRLPSEDLLLQEASALLSYLFA